jgi:Zn-finger nucleic acid-binding protein
MKCFNCDTHSLAFGDIFDGLRAQRCSVCSGTWISSNDFLAWRRTHSPLGDVVESDSALDLAAHSHDSHNLKLCLDCGHFMFRFDVLPHGLFKVDHCGHCNAVWLDAVEWDALLSHNLHARLNELFTATWQEHIRQSRQCEWFDNLYSQRFGSDYLKIKEFRTWALSHEKSSMILAFLTARDPYSP